MAENLPLGSESIPSVGFGCWKVPNENAADIIFKAIEIGYRHLDCAADYGNEKEVGQGIRRALEAGLCKRSDLHVTSKLWNTYHAKDHVLPACERTLEDLGLDFVDLYLVHFPIALKFVPFEKRYPPGWTYDPDVAIPKMEFAKVPMQETWIQMESLKEMGVAKHIGVSNYNYQSLKDLLNYATIKPSALQIEAHPYLQQNHLLRFAQGEGLHVTAYSPLGQGASYWQDSIGVMYEDVVKKIAKDHGKSEAQVILRWGVQRGCSIIPKSEKLDRMKENLSLFDFSLTPTDLTDLAKLDRNLRFNNPANYCESAFNTHCPIFD